MKFVDQAKIYITSGNGGAGCVSFRREKFVPKGGPDGGNGGDGGQVIVRASSQKDTLYRFHLNQHFKAENGRPGMGKKRNGPKGNDRVITVPLGTVVFEVETGEKLADLNQAGAEYLAAKGGMGGLGNANFATATNRAPRHAQPGTSGEEKRLLLELRLLADVGLLGFPNVGKSTLISSISAARPKIADYPFTTLIPNLGVVDVDGEHTFVIADLPGLMAGASQGVGLGHRFLKHVSRCGVLLHILDPLEVDPDNPLEKYEIINQELASYNPKLMEKIHLLAISKMDLAEGELALQKVKDKINDRPIYAFSAVSGFGLKELKFALWQALQNIRAQEEKNNLTNLGEMEN